MGEVVFLDLLNDFQGLLMGTFSVLYAFGYSVNTLTMFAMVLAIGLLVDDAIVVVENVERIMSEDHRYQY